FDWRPGGHDDMVAWLLQMKSRGAMLCSACSGALLLAQTGVLDNYKATTHWAYAELFQQLFPAIDLCPEQLLMTTGDNDSILMSGSAGSWHDLALYLITQYVSLAAAQTISKFMLLEWHPDGLLPYMMFMPKRKHGDAIILQAQD
ncbi:MAG TPA: transcriptional regulator, partial [Gammaproteobacteria bacterium]|nr:transcriptional regulator [Gammaproteobacteria bacterium]